MLELNNNDYKKILKYYNKTIPKSNALLKKDATKIITEKLCKCIKKLDPINEARSIGICTKTIINNKGYTRGKFKCKGKRSITLKKTRKYKNKKN
jgi:hypothetical protein